MLLGISDWDLGLLRSGRDLPCQCSCKSDTQSSAHPSHKDCHWHLRTESEIPLKKSLVNLIINPKVTVRQGDNLLLGKETKLVSQVWCGHILLSIISAT